MGELQAGSLLCLPRPRLPRSSPHWKEALPASCVVSRWRAGSRERRWVDVGEPGGAGLQGGSC